MQFREPDFRATSHARFRPDDRCLDDGLISIAWNAGTIHVQYVGLQEVDQSAVDVIGDTMWKFATECQLMLVLYAGVLGSRAAIQKQLGSNLKQDTPFTIAGSNVDGTVRAIWARLPRGRVLDAFSEDGDFETIYAKAFVVFTYQLWEEFARPSVAQALDVKHHDVQSDLMGEWRHLRNWLIHPVENTEQEYFKNAKMLAKVLRDMRPGNPEVKAGMVFPLMGYLNSLHVIVNPDGLSPGIELSPLDPTIVEQASKELSSPGMTVSPIWRGFNPPGPADEDEEAARDA